MSYIDAFVAAVPGNSKDAYLGMAEAMWAFFREHGALSMWECWEEDVPEGEVTSFPMAVKRQEGEKIVFSFIEWPDKETGLAAFSAMTEDPGMGALEMPFDGKRMIIGGFDLALRKTRA